MLQKQTHPRAQRWAVCPKTRGNLSLCPRQPPWRIKDNHLSSAYKQTLHLDLLQTQRTLTWSCSSWGGRRHLWQRCKSFCHKSPPRGQKHWLHSSSSTLQIRFSLNEQAVKWTDKHTPWCKRFCLGIWWISPDTRSSTSDSTTGTWCTYSELLWMMMMDRWVNIYATLKTSLPGHAKDAFRRSWLLEYRFTPDLCTSLINSPLEILMMDCSLSLHRTVIKTEADLSACGPDTPAEPWWSEWLRG